MHYFSKIPDHLQSIESHSSLGNEKIKILLIPCVLQPYLISTKDFQGPIFLLFHSASPK